jgi:hypothetical protein
VTPGYGIRSRPFTIYFEGMDHGNAKGCCDSFVSTTTTTRWILVPNTLDRDNSATRNATHSTVNAHAATATATVWLPRRGHAIYSRLHHQYGTCVALEEPTTDLKDSSASSTRVDHDNGQLARVALKDRNLSTETTLVPVRQLIPL